MSHDFRDRDRRRQDLVERVEQAVAVARARERTRARAQVQPEDWQIDYDVANMRYICRSPFETMHVRQLTLIEGRPHEVLEGIERAHPGLGVALARIIADGHVIPRRRRVYEQGNLFAHAERVQVQPLANMYGQQQLFQPNPLMQDQQVFVAPRRRNPVEQPSQQRRASAEERGMRLFAQHITAEQRHDFVHLGYIRVTGGDSGLSYRIYYGTHTNVTAERSIQNDMCTALCTIPKGGLVAGDVMLAQKLDLECDENAFLRMAIRGPSLVEAMCGFNDSFWRQWMKQEFAVQPAPAPSPSPVAPKRAPPRRRGWIDWVTS